MEKALRNAPTVSVVVALIIQVTRVSDFGTRIGAGILAWVYAFFLAMTIYALSYWVGRLHYDVTATPEEKAKYAQQKRMEKLFDRAKWNAQIWLMLFILIDGGLNLAETMSSLPKDILFWQYAGAVVYGVFPTLAALGLGSLQALIDKIPAGASKASFVSKIGDKLLAMLDASDKQLQPVLAQGKQDRDASDKQLHVQDDKPLLTYDNLLAYINSNPQASDGQVAKHFGVKRQAIQQRRKKLIERGAFMLPVAQKEPAVPAE